ncbi:MAG: hypothetical protein JXK04_08275 [Campylobacterales bacterium]|nr:hypothetical protein [Campylobacterales bacterium]
MNRSTDIPVHDIYPLVDVADYSLYYFIALVVVGVAVVLGILFWLLKRIRTRRISGRQTAFDQLKTLDFTDPKRAAYALSEIGRLFAHDNERTAKAYQNLFERLERYKYAPRVEKIDEETLGYYRLYLEIIDA